MIAPPTDTDASAKQLAERCAAIMWEDDHAARGLGFELLDVGPGRARLRMSVRPNMVNGHGICHGGFIFTLADAAFSYACNSENQRAVAAGGDISFLAPAHIGDVLECLCRRQHQGARNGIYDSEVRTPDGRLIAVFRGRSTRITGQFFTATDTPPGTPS